MLDKVAIQANQEDLMKLVTLAAEETSNHKPTRADFGIDDILRDLN